MNYVVRVCAAMVDDILSFDLSEENFGLRNQVLQTEVLAAKTPGLCMKRHKMS